MREWVLILDATFAAITYPAALKTCSTAPLQGRPGGCQAAWGGGGGIATPAYGAALLPPAQLTVSCHPTPDADGNWGPYLLSEQLCMAAGLAGVQGRAWLQGWLVCRAGHA